MGYCSIVKIKGIVLICCLESKENEEVGKGFGDFGISGIRENDWFWYWFKNFDKVKERRKFE